MDGRIKQSYWSSEAKPDQLCCGLQSFFPLFSNVYLFFFDPTTNRVTLIFSFFFNKRDSHLCLDSWSSKRGEEGRKAFGTTRCPCWQRYIKIGMSQPSSSLCQQRGFLCTSTFSFSSVSSLPHLCLPHPSSRSLWSSSDRSANNTTPDQDANRSKAQCL